MNLLTDRINGCSLWAITPESFAALLSEIAHRTFFADREFSLLKSSTLGNSQSNKVALVPVQGILTKDSPWAGTTYGAIASGVEQAVSNPSVKRIVLAVDSPGGEVTGLPETAEVIRRAAKEKPVSAMVEGTSASAAYWLTSQASDITLAPSSEVGSVGVRMMHVDVSKAMEDAGLKVTELYSGDFKTEWSPFKPLSDAATEDMQKRLDSVHRDFLNAVASGRGPRVTAKISAARFGEGRMFSASDAMGHGLADVVQAPREFYRAVTAAGEDNPASPTHLRRARLELERTKF
jgi:signal peptide peptidase SppA